jgi:EAL domain-containing protein (putative c-di-GMP-specific phosphodiesterase class I)
VAVFLTATALSGLWMAYQPILRSSDGSLFGYEALVRTAESTLPHPGALFDAAERLGRVHELGRAIRAKVADSLKLFSPKTSVFVNLHPHDLLDDMLFLMILSRRPSSVSESPTNALPDLPDSPRCTLRARHG